MSRKAYRMSSEAHTETEDFYEAIEPTPGPSAYRDAAMLLLPLIESGIAHCLAAQTPEVGRIQIKFALGLEERSMRDVATSLGVTVACISRGAKEFVDANNLPTPPCMKSPEASESYRKSREKQLKPRPN